jgi:hypothetical protein
MASGARSAGLARLAAATSLLLAACASTPAPTPVADGPAVSSAASASVAASALAGPAASPTIAPTATATIVATGPIADSGAIALLGVDGGLVIVGADGRSVPLASAGDGTFTFPAWSPDGTRLAAVHYGHTSNELIVFDDAQHPRGGTPTTLLDSPEIAPFYLSWSPDGRRVSYLATIGSDLSLRQAPADGSAPTDGSGPDATIGAGSPLYYDWLSPDRLLVHIGTGSQALVGELGLDGAPVGPAFGRPGVFRSAVVSPGGAVAYVRGEGADGEVVVVARDGATEHTMPVGGPAAMNFSPSGELLATIGSLEPVDPSQIPVGPLRVLDPASGTVRPLLDGAVVSFWWSPDGKTIAALRVQRASAEAAASPSASIAAGASPTPPTNEIRLLFVDVATGDIAAQPVVQPGQVFVDQLLPFFDQYALSHELWAPDSSSILFPTVDPAGTPKVALIRRDGSQPVELDGVIGFWSPAGA